MNWKVFTTAFVSAALLALPQNSFTCGGSEDPYDYYTSFFSNRLGTGKEYRPFYYTSLLNFYDDWSQDTATHEADPVLAEWLAYTKTSKLPDAVQLVYEASSADVAALAKAVAGTGAVPPLFKANTLAQNLVTEKKKDAIAYLQFAKRVAAVSCASAWEAVPKRDSVQLNRWIADADAAFAKTTEPFLKTKYAFQRCKIAFYNNRHNDCIRYFDAAFDEKATVAVAPLALSYKAGSLYRVGKKKEAAYLFSKLFAQARGPNKKTAYLGFWFASNNADVNLVPAYSALCKTNAEKANMHGMFALYGTGYQLDALQTIYELDPASPLLPLLATREINKLEEHYLTPLLDSEKGGRSFYMSWRGDEPEEKTKQAGHTQATKTAAFFEKLASNNASPSRSLYFTSAAYLRFMTKDYAGAKALLAKATPADVALKEQAQLIQLLIAANEGQSLTKDREAQLLPSLKWLVQKAKTDENYRTFCRNFFSEILAQKYEQQGDASRAALAYGVADLSFVSATPNEEWYDYSNAVEFVRNDMSTDALFKLYETVKAPQTEADKFLVQNSTVKRDAIVDVIGTAHLRDRAYTKVIEWLGKASKLTPLTETQYNYKTGKETSVNIDPLHDYLNDWQRYSKGVATPYTKLTLAKKLLELQTKIQQIDTVSDKARLYYQYASALYNMSHYGNSWSAVAFNRSGVDWNDGNYKLPWQKEFFGVYEARDFYQKAYEAATDKEFKAACLFMVIKCAQRQVPLPSYDYKNEVASDKASKAFDEKFRYNPLFEKFKTEFAPTKFYRYAYNRCSYLRDFVKRSEANKVNPMK